MRTPPLASALLGLLVAVALLAACLPDQAPAGEGRGHETATTVPKAAGPKPKEERASKVVEPTPTPPSSACRSILDRVQSIEKVAPDAAIYRHWAGTAALDFLDQFNREHGTKVRADEIAIVISADWGERAIVLFAHNGCPVETEQVTYGLPVPSDAR
jgi:hypothetical protein